MRDESKESLRRRFGNRLQNGKTLEVLINGNVSFLLSDPNPPLDITTENKNIISNEAVSFTKLSFNYSLPRKKARHQKPISESLFLPELCFTTVRVALFCMFHCETCVPAWLILYNVTGSCKGPRGRICFHKLKKIYRLQKHQ